jgi:hypothetical protein
MQHLLKLLILNDPMFIPCSIVQRNILLFVLLAHQRQIKNLVPFLISHVKGLLHLQDINLENKPHSQHGNHLAQWNNHPRLAFGEILYFLRISFVFIFVWFCTARIILVNDKLSSSI